MIQLFDEARSQYLSTNQLPKKTLTALGEFRELLLGLDGSSEAVENIRHVRLEKHGGPGKVWIDFQMTLAPENKWIYELRFTLGDLLKIEFGRSGTYQIASWKEGIEISIA